MSVEHFCFHLALLSIRYNSPIHQNLANQQIIPSRQERADF